MPTRISKEQKIKEKNQEEQEEKTEEMKREHNEYNISDRPQKEENQRSTMRESKKETSIPKNTASSSSKWGVWWIVMLIIMLFWITWYTIWKIDTIEKRYERTISNLNEEISSLNKEIDQTKVKTQEISTLTSKVNSITDRQVYSVTYAGSKNQDNSVDWIWERSLGFPNYLSGKVCYILWSKMDGENGWTIRWYLGKDNNKNNHTYSFSPNYEAYVNNGAKKIEITKWNGSQNVNLTQSERNNLYFSLRLLCRDSKWLFDGLFD